VQGLAWDRQGRLFATEFGQNRVDEVNRIQPGGNYGWPEVEGTGGGGRFRDPLVTWPVAQASPSGAAIAGDTLYVAALRGERLWLVPLDGAGGSAAPGLPSPAPTAGCGGRRCSTPRVGGGVSTGPAAGQRHTGAVLARVDRDRTGGC
jgi:Glucose / Sorbosone dehydrogenase